MSQTNGPVHLPTGNLPNYTVQIVNDTNDIPPHTFLLITGPNGTTYGYGFAPSISLLPLAPGQVFDNTNHPYNDTSGPISLTADQYNNLAQFINNSIDNPPWYNIFDGQECTAWAAQALYAAGATDPIIPPGGDLGLFQLLLYNPYTIGESQQQVAGNADSISEDLAALAQYNVGILTGLPVGTSGSQTVTQSDGSYFVVGSPNSDETTVNFFSPTGAAAASEAYFLNPDGSANCSIDDVGGSFWTNSVFSYSSSGALIDDTQDNDDGTSQITIPGNSSTDTPTIATYYSGPNGTGTITKTDQENSNGTSQITIFNPDGSSTSTYYSGANGTGSVTKIDQENADGSSTITTFNPNGSPTTITYSQPNGNGVITSSSVTDSYGVITSQINGAIYSYSGNELYGPPGEDNGGPPIGVLTGNVTFAVVPDTGAVTSNAIGLDFDAFGTQVTNLTNAVIAEFDGNKIAYWYVGEVSPDYLSGFTTDYAPSSGYYGQDVAESGSVDGGNDDAPGTWEFTGYSTLITISPNAGQTEQLADALSNPNLAPENVMENVTIGGAGVVELTGTASIPFVLVTSSGSLLLEGGVLNTDPITIDSTGLISGNGTVAGGETNNGSIIASGGLLDLSGDIGGTGTLGVGAGATLSLEGTAAVSQSLQFDGSDGSLLFGPSSDILGTISGFAPGNFIGIEGKTVTVATYNATSDQLTLTTSDETAFTLSLSGTYQPSDFVLSDGEVVDHALCFLEGTRIRTPGGETPIEQLKIGDLVMTGAGDAKPIKWIGIRAYDGRFIAGNHLALPVCIKQNAIAGRVPARDLNVSPGHGVFFDGVLVPAWRLVNGVSITQAESVASVRYINVELESHEVILANNCPAETFLNIGNFREQFQNADEFKKLYPDDDGEQRAFIPRLEEGFKLHAIHSYLAGRAGVAMPAEGQGDMVHGFVDEAGPARVRGWVQCVDKPEAPVSVDIWVGGRLVARALANGYRADLRKAGLGSGCHGFDMPLPAGLSGPVRVRRVVDQAEIGLTDTVEIRAA